MPRIVLPRLAPLPPGPPIPTEPGTDFQDLAASELSGYDDGAAAADGFIADAAGFVPVGEDGIVNIGLTMADGADAWASLDGDLDTVDFTPDIELAQQLEAGIAATASDAGALGGSLPPAGGGPPTVGGGGAGSGAGATTCPPGYVFDPEHGICIPLPQTCPAGYYWSSTLNKCVPIPPHG